MLEIDWNTSTILAEVFYCIIGLIFAFTGVNALKNKEVEKRTTTAIFWFILAITFIAGPYIPRSMYYCFSYLNCYWFSTTSSNAYSYC